MTVQNMIIRRHYRFTFVPKQACRHFYKIMMVSNGFRFIFKTRISCKLSSRVNAHLDGIDDFGNDRECDLLFKKYFLLNCD